MKQSHKKHLGQHFLVDKNIVHKIIKEFSPSGNDLIVEIGPGRGALTEELINYSKNLILVEIDKSLVEYLNSKFSDIKIINKDILECNFGTDFFDTKFRIIGNLPYYITSQILFKIFDNYKVINDVVVMIQKEVAQRIIASPKTKAYGILSVFSQFYSEPSILFYVSKNVFLPKPEVDSAVIQLKIKNQIELNTEEEKYFRQIVKTSFNQRRKTLRNSLQNIFNEKETLLKEKFLNLDFNFSKRAEELNFEDFIYLAKIFYQMKVYNK